MNHLANQYGPWALVTGASTGIGAEISHKLAAAGLNIVATARNAERLETLQQTLQSQYGVQVETVSVDLSAEGAAAQLAQQTEHLDIGLLVANAGMENNGHFGDIDLASETRLLALNVVSPMQLSHAFTRRFKQRGGGGILLTSSLFAYQGVPYFANYAASKAYVLALGEALNVELKPYKIDVSVLSPGFTITPMTEDIDIDFNKIPISQHQPGYVADTGLKALGRKASVIPGFLNNFFAWQNRLIPRVWPTQLFGKLIERASSYGAKSEPEPLVSPQAR